ncbi:DUF7793 family protein [Zunongwangia sp. HGR-M22]|uniref:DUF7793 family protein n=1 Tax=Zunongwangia sp. HGR-M22 TaxID=3015168 RepID=UPI0022DE7D98|nr:hypothetical protein [Zunongwangia sp. HGR-M22]WBL26704.1 hypothetical protein PBT91_05395 [Zunongwangia sp. HGR-M22]
MRKETKYTEMWINDGILYFKYKPIPEINLRKAKVIVAQRLLFQNEKLYPILCDMRKIGNITDEAMSFLASDGTVMIKALAIIAHSSYEHYMGKIFIDFHHPHIPTKLCFKQHEAIEFLKPFR